MGDQNKATNAELNIHNKKISDSDLEIIDQLNKLPLSEKEKSNIIATLEMYSGPIPHPKILAGYQALYPGSAKKIIDNGIEESVHRRKLESVRQKRRGRLAWASMIALIIVCIGFILGSFYLILKNHTIIGSIFGGSSFIILISCFFNNIDELSDKNDISVNKAGSKK